MKKLLVLMAIVMILFGCSEKARTDNFEYEITVYKNNEESIYVVEDYYSNSDKNILSLMMFDINGDLITKIQGSDFSFTANKVEKK